MKLVILIIFSSCFMGNMLWANSAKEKSKPIEPKVLTQDMLKSNAPKSSIEKVPNMEKGRGKGKGKVKGALPTPSKDPNKEGAASQEKDPALMLPKFGGTIQEFNGNYVELVTRGKVLEIYVYNSRYEPIDPKEIQLEVELKKKDSKDRQAVTLNYSNFFYKGVMAEEPSPQTSIILALTDIKVGHPSRLTLPLVQPK